MTVMVIRHQADPIATDGGWMPHCICSWRDCEHIGAERDAALRLSLDHLARCPESWAS